MIGLGLDGYEPDSGHESAIAFRIRVVEAEQYIPAHSHRKGQLILALHGALTCEVENAMDGAAAVCGGFRSCPTVTALPRRPYASCSSSRAPRRCRIAAVR